MKYELKPYQRVHRAFFSTGEVIEARCSRKEWKQHISVHLQYMDDSIERAVWFRPCQAWKDACKKADQIYAARYRKDPILRQLLLLEEDDNDSE